MKKKICDWCHNVGRIWRWHDDKSLHIAEPCPQGCFWYVPSLSCRSAP